MKVAVSIPGRVLGELEHILLCRFNGTSQFQSLEGFWVNWNRRESVIASIFSFQGWAARITWIIALFS